MHRLYIDLNEERFEEIELKENQFDYLIQTSRISNYLNQNSYDDSSLGVNVFPDTSGDEFVVVLEYAELAEKVTGIEFETTERDDFNGVGGYLNNASGTNPISSVVRDSAGITQVLASTGWTTAANKTQAVKIESQFLDRPVVVFISK